MEDKKYAKLCLDGRKIMFLNHILSIGAYKTLLAIRTATNTRKKTKNSSQKCETKVSKQFKP